MKAPSSNRGTCNITVYGAAGNGRGRRGLSAESRTKGWRSVDNLLRPPHPVNAYVCNPHFAGPFTALSAEGGTRPDVYVGFEKRESLKCQARLRASCWPARQDARERA